MNCLKLIMSNCHFDYVINPETFIIIYKFYQVCQLITNSIHPSWRSVNHLSGIETAAAGLNSCFQIIWPDPVLFLFYFAEFPDEIILIKPRLLLNIIIAGP